MRAMILAAGRGERMRPLTDHCPKPLLPVAGKPLLQWHIEALVGAGVRDIVINHAHLGHMIEAHFGTGQALGAHLHYSPEPLALETAGGIRQALHHLAPGGSPEPFLVMNGDVFSDWPIQNAVQRCQELGNGLAHVVLVPNPQHHPQGDFILNPQGIVGSGPVDLSNAASLSYTFAGIGVYSPKLFAALPVGTAAPLGPLLRQAMNLGAVTGELHTGLWVDVGTPQRLANLETLLLRTSHPSQFGV